MSPRTSAANNPFRVLVCVSAARGGRDPAGGAISYDHAASRRLRVRRRPKPTALGRSRPDARRLAPRSRREDRPASMALVPGTSEGSARRGAAGDLFPIVGRGAQTGESAAPSPRWRAGQRRVRWRFTKAGNRHGSLADRGDVAWTDPPSPRARGGASPSDAATRNTATSSCGSRASGPRRSRRTARKG